MKLCVIISKQIKLAPQNLVKILSRYLYGAFSSLSSGLSTQIKWDLNHIFYILLYRFSKSITVEHCSLICDKDSPPPPNTNPKNCLPPNTGNNQPPNTGSRNERQILVVTTTETILSLQCLNNVVSHLFYLFTASQPTVGF